MAILNTPATVEQVHAQIDLNEPAAFEAVRDWVRLPSFSDTGEGMPEAAEYTCAVLAQIALDARVVPTAGWPVVYGTVPATMPDAPTLIVYGLYDVTPLVELEWTVPPLEARVMDAKDLGILPFLGRVLVGRGTNNHKGPVMAVIHAIKTMLELGADIPVNLHFVIEGEEEIGSPNLPEFVEAHREALSQADGVWLPCMQQNSAGTMTLRRAFKGSLFATLECTGGDWGGTRDGRHVWAGNSAWIDAPLMKLTRALATLYDDQQRATVDGFERIMPPVSADSPEVQALEQAFLENPKWEQNMLSNLNAAGFLGGARLSEHLAHYMLGTTINLQGIQGGYQGPTYYTNMPGAARAKLDFRFPPGITPHEVADLVQSHLNRRGHQNVRLAQIRGYSGAPALSEEDDTLLQAARATASKHNVNVSVWPIANNCCPAALFTTLERHLPFSIAGTGHGDRAHAPDEYITVDSVGKLMHWTVDYLYAWREAVLALRDADRR
jgi:acetylornithine deacetylase/succinyl-diaminopimelate desuccinylase-like protein